MLGLIKTGGGGLSEHNFLPQDFQYIYRPQTKFAKVMFLHMSVSHSVYGGGLVSASVHAGIHPQEHTPWGADPHSACWEIRATSGQYASYWNAYLLTMVACHFRYILTILSINKNQYQ